MQNNKKVLVLGCGKKPRAGAVNHDLTLHHDYVGVAHDLNVFPWPWKDEEFDHVSAIAVLEHLMVDRLKIMNELWRILKPGGTAVIKLPHWGSDMSYADMTHYWFASPKVMDQLDPDTRRGREYDFYTPFKWKIKNKNFTKGKTSIIFTMSKRPLAGG